MTNTSAKAYREEKESGRLNEWEYRVWNQLATYGPATGEQLDRSLNNPSAHKRLSALAGLGYAEHCGTTRSETTGKIVHKWRITAQGQLPLIEPPKPTRKQLFAELSAYRAKYGPLEVAPLYFYSVSGCAAPSPYYRSLAVLLESKAYKATLLQKRIWTGSHTAPIPVEVK